MTVPMLDKTRLSDANTAWEFWQKHGRELLAKHPNQFVALEKGQVVAVNSDLVELTADIEAQGLSPSQLLIKFLNTHPEQMVL